jgi:flagellin
MRELAVQAKTGTYQGADLTNADFEYAALKSEIERIAGVTAFNRLALGQGSGGVADGTTLSKDTSFSFYVGSDVARTGNSVTFSAAALDLNKTASTTLKSISTAALAGSAIESLDQAITLLGANRANAGALVNRLEHTVSNLMNVSQRLQEAVSGIEDADYAAESAALARGMVLAQAGTAMLAQANQAPQFVLTLLRS